MRAAIHLGLEKDRDHTGPLFVLDIAFNCVASLSLLCQQSMHVRSGHSHWLLYCLSVQWSCEEVAPCPTTSVVDIQTSASVSKRHPARNSSELDVHWFWSLSLCFCAAAVKLFRQSKLH
eukprot:1845937-Amphidinium_carterae.1